MTCVNQISYDWFIKFQNNYKAEQTENGLVTTLAIRYVYNIPQNSKWSNASVIDQSNGRLLYTKY